jgi:hypothetical protein
MEQDHGRDGADPGGIGELAGVVDVDLGKTNPWLPFPG